MKFSSAYVCGLLATAVAYPINTRTSTCSTDGALVCHGSSQFSICNNGAAMWMDVSEGTICVCSGDNCTIEPDSKNSIATSTEPSAVSTSAFPTLSASSSSSSSPPDPISTMTTAPVSTSVPVYTTAPVSSLETSATPLSTTWYATSYAASPSALPSSTIPTAVSSTSSAATSTSTGALEYIKMFTGNGETSTGWPAQSDWLSFEEMWATNLENVISGSCSSFGQKDNSATESDNIKSAVLQIASSTGVDERFILAIVLQESNGCVRVPTTDNGVVNPGLMQSHDGSHTCYGTAECAADEIKGMVRDGTKGTTSGDGLEQLIAQLEATDVSKYYKAAVLYNSGSIPVSGDLQDATATRCYATDIANRLMGWSKGPSGCTA